MTERSHISAGVGGTLSLEFANTAGWHLATEPIERLETWRDVVRWANEQHIVSSDQLDRLSCTAVRIEPALALRETIFRIGLAIANGDSPEKRDLAAVVTQAATPPPAATWSNERLSWLFRAEHVSPELLGLIARDAVGLFSSDRVAKVRLCAGSKCGWLFIDDSRGKPRRWCSMSDCGNRAKARRSYSRRNC